jgi:hypothetical protein
MALFRPVSKIKISDVFHRKIGWKIQNPHVIVYELEGDEVRL